MSSSLSSTSRRPPRPSNNTTSSSSASGGLRPKTVDEFCSESERKKSLLSMNPRPPSSSSSNTINNNNNTPRHQIVHVRPSSSSSSATSGAMPGITSTGNHKNSGRTLEKQLEPVNSVIKNASIFNSTTRTTILSKAAKTHVLDSVAADKHPPEDLVPLHLRPFVASDAYKTIMHKFEQQRALFASSVVCAETAFREVLDATAGDAKKGRADPIRSAVACGLLKRLLPPSAESASAKLLHQLVGEMARAIFDVGDADSGTEAAKTRQKKQRKQEKTKAMLAGNKSNYSSSRGGGGDYDESSSDDEDSSDDENNNRNSYLDHLDANIDTNQNSQLLDQEPFDQLMLRPLYFQQVARVRDDLYVSQTSEQKLKATIKKQAVILDQSIDRWQQMLVRRVFTVWRKHTIHYRPKNFEGRFRMLSSSKTRQLLANSFTGWRHVVTASGLSRTSDEVHFLKLELARTQTIAAKNEKELRTEISQLIENGEALQGTIASLKEDISNISDQVEEERRRGDVAVQMGDKWRETCLKIVTSLSTGKRSTHRFKKSIGATAGSGPSSKHNNTHHHSSSAAAGDENRDDPMTNMLHQIFGGNNNFANHHHKNNHNNSKTDAAISSHPELMLMPEEVLPVSFDFDMPILQKAVVDAKMAKELGLLSSNQHQEQQELEQKFNNSSNNNNNDNNDQNNSNDDGMETTSEMSSTSAGLARYGSALTAAATTVTEKKVSELATTLLSLQRQLPTSVLRVPISSEFIYRAPLILAGLEELHGLISVSPDQDNSNRIIHIIPQDNVIGGNSNNADDFTSKNKNIHLAVSPQSNASHNPFFSLLRTIEDRVSQETAASSGANSPFFASFSRTMLSTQLKGNNIEDFFEGSVDQQSLLDNTFSSSPLNGTATATSNSNLSMTAMIMKQLSDAPAQTLLLSWVNSICQQSPLVKRLLDTKHYHFEQHHQQQQHSSKKKGDHHQNENNNPFTSHFSTTLVSMMQTSATAAASASSGSKKKSHHSSKKAKRALTAEMQRVATRCSLGDPVVLNQIIGTAPCLPAIDLPVRNFGVNFSSGDVLLFLAESLGALSLHDLRARYNVKELQSKQQQEKEQREMEMTLALTQRTGGKGGCGGGGGAGGGSSKGGGLSSMTCHPIVGRILRARVTDVAAASGITNLATAEHEQLLDALFAIVVLQDVWDKVDLALRALHDVFVDPQGTDLFVELHRNRIMEGLAPTDLRLFLCQLFSSYSDYGVNPNIGMSEIMMSVFGNQNHGNHNENNNTSTTSHPLNSTVTAMDKSSKKKQNKAAKKKNNDDEEGENHQDEESSSSSSSDENDDDDSSSNDDQQEGSSGGGAHHLFFNNVAEQKRKPLTLITAPYLALAKERRNFQAQSWLCRVSNALAQEATSPSTLFPLSLADSKPEIEELLMKCVAARVSRCQQWRDKWKFVSSLVNDKFRKEDEDNEVNGGNVGDEAAAATRANTTNRTSTTTTAVLSPETLRELNLLSLTHDQSLEAVVKRFETMYSLSMDNSQGRAILMGIEEKTGNSNINNNGSGSPLSASLMSGRNTAGSSMMMGSAMNESMAKSARNNNSMAKSTKKKSIMVMSGAGSIRASSSEGGHSSSTTQSTVAVSNDEVIRLNKHKIRKLEWPTYQVLFPMMQRMLHFNTTSSSASASSASPLMNNSNIDSTTTTSSTQQQKQQFSYSFDRKIRRVFHSYATRSVASSVSGSSVSVGVHYGMTHSSFREFVVANGFHTKPANAGLSKRALGSLYDLLVATRVTARDKGQGVKLNMMLNNNNSSASFRSGSNTFERKQSTTALNRKRSTVSFEKELINDSENNNDNNNTEGGSPLPLTRKNSLSASTTTILSNIKPLNNLRDDLDLPPGQLSLGDFSAIISFVACSLAFADTKKLFDSNLVLTHLKQVVESLKPRPTTRRNERDAFQQSVDAFDVQAVFELHNNALRRAFIKAAAADGDPEMSLDEFMFVMRTTRLQVVVGADHLRDIFSRFAGGSEGSLLYRDFLDCLCVIAMYCDPSPFSPLSEKVSMLIKGPIAERSLPGLLSSMGVKSVH